MGQPAPLTSQHQRKTERHGGAPGARGWPIGLVLGGLLVAALVLAGPAGALSRYTLETDHFFIHFDAGYEALAREAAVIAEEVHQELAPRVGHVPSEKTHLALLDTTDLANGTADPMLYPKIVIFPVYPTHFSPYGSGISPRLRDWMRLVILHEYAHALHLDMNDGGGKVVEQLFGRLPYATNPIMHQGYAFIEGFATYQETVANLGGRGHDPYYEMFLRTMVLEDDFLRLDQILGHYPLERWKPGAVVYLYGYSLWAYMASRYGEETLRAFNQTFAQTASLDATFQEVLGTSPEAFYREWQAHLKSVYGTELEALRAQGVTPAEPLGGEGYVPESPVASPDGRRIAYVTTSGPVAPALRILEWEGTAVRDRQVVAGLLMGPVAWSPDGQTLYYAKVELDGARTFTDLYAYDLAAGRERRLTRGLRAFGPAPSPDGKLIAFTSREALATRLLELDLSGPLPAGPESPELRELLPAQGERQLLAAGWFPDGESLLVASHEVGGGMDLLRLDLRSGHLEPLVVGSRARGGPGSVNQNAQFTPDGRFILFDSDRTGVYSLYAYDLASQETFQVARSLTGLFDPTLVQTESGPRLVAMEYTAGGYRLSLLPYTPERWERAEGAPLSAEAGGLTGAPSHDPLPAPGTEPFPGTRRAVPWDPEGTQVRPYRPWSSLRPRFTLPLITDDEAGPVIGAMTFGYDAYQERSYSLAAGYGLASERPLVAFEYEGPFLGHPQATWALGARQETVVQGDDKAGTLERELRLEMTYAWPGLLAGTSVTAGVQIWDEKEVRAGGSPGHPLPGQAVTLGVGRARSWPVDGRAFDLESGLTITGLREGPGWRREGLLATWRERAALSWKNGRQSLVADAIFGGSTLEDAFAVGERGPVLAAGQSLWTLNAEGPTLEGQHAARLTLSLNSQLLHLSRGVGTWPIFFDDLGGRFYVEGGAAWEALDRPPQRRWGVGAEASLTAYVGYAIPLTLSVGVAASVEPRASTPTVYLRLDLSDPLGSSARTQGITRAGAP